MPISKSRYDWFFRYKLYHIPFWFAYHCMWWMITIGSISGVASNVLGSAYSIKFLFYVVFQAAAVYFNLYYLIPKFLEKGKYVQFIIYVVLTILVAASVIVLGYYTSSWVSGIPFKEMYGRDPKNFMYFFQINTLPSTVASMTLGMSVKLTKNWLKAKQREKLLEKEKLETELNYLRSQFNPHFLFNTINSIFFLIHKNPDQASASLAKFSELLRYQLYECNDRQIPLRNEIAYMENFIELEKLRQNDYIDVDFAMNGQYQSDLFIAPFILMTFVENAFKHVSKDAGQKNWIRIYLDINEKQLSFSVSNSFNSFGSNDVVKYGGIGLRNVQRRLDLLYPGEYKLDISNTGKSFEVKLTCTLSDLQTKSATDNTKQNVFILKPAS
ncbi:MAG: histidine kinase [Chitinophagaceae bacterium]